MQTSIKPKSEREAGHRNAHEQLLAAWENYQVNGQHVSEEEADTWLARLEAGEDVPPPPCHG